MTRGGTGPHPTPTKEREATPPRPSFICAPDSRSASRPVALALRAACSSAPRLAAGSAQAESPSASKDSAVRVCCCAVLRSRAAQLRIAERQPVAQQERHPGGGRHPRQRAAYEMSIRTKPASTVLGTGKIPVRLMRNHTWETFSHEIPTDPNFAAGRYDGTPAGLHPGRAGRALLGRARQSPSRSGTPRLNRCSALGGRLAERESPSAK